MRIRAVTRAVDSRIDELGYNQAGQYAAAKSFGWTLASYTYDGFGRRVEKRLSGEAGERYSYGQDGMLIEEADLSGATQADYIYLAGMPVAVIEASGAIEYLHTDHLGTPRFATDAGQAIT